MSDDILFAVLTISDTCHVDATRDKSGPRLVELISTQFANARILTDILPDEQQLIEAKLRKLVAQGEGNHVSAIITTGGTGFAPRDVTPEATKPLIDKECPQLSMFLAINSLHKTPFAALSRGICGISGHTLIMNFPGSEKAVVECFETIRPILPHALQLISNELPAVRQTHAQLMHTCPHKTGLNDGTDRHSPFPMMDLDKALQLIFANIAPHRADFVTYKSSLNVPEFRASIKDGYAVKSSGFSGAKKVVGFIAAGDEINDYALQEDECFKINTGAAVPQHADCIIQIEDTKLLKTDKNGQEDLVEILIEPLANLDIRPIGCDLRAGDNLFPKADLSPVVAKSILASVGFTLPENALNKPKIAIISTGSELLAPGTKYSAGKIYDSNTTMLDELVKYFGFQCTRKLVLNDSFDTVLENISELLEENFDIIICSGGVSMGDKDYVKPVLEKLGFQIGFGRVNIKPGKPMTYATKAALAVSFFGLPGNPVSSFVTFHLCVLPALRWFSGWDKSKCTLPQIRVTLANEKLALDPRPEFVRASVTSRNGRLYVNVTGDQLSSRLQSIVGADVLINLPARTECRQFAQAGDEFTAHVLRHDFISHYE